MMLKWIHVEELTPWDKNPWRHDDNQVLRLKRSILELGWGAPCVVNTDLQLIAGHGRRVAALHILEDDPTWITPGAPGPGFIPCRILALNDEQAAQMAMADNRLQVDARLDERRLVDVFEMMEESFGTQSFELTGFVEDEIDSMISKAALDAAGGVSGGTPPEVPDKPVSKRGEVYRLGPHTLVCGSSSDASSYEALEGPVDAVWTDPPYGIDYGSDADDAKHDKIAADETEDAAEALMRQVFPLALSHCRPGAPWYVCCAAGPMIGKTGRALQELEPNLWKHTIIWVKDRLVLGRCDRHYQHEPILYGWVPGAARGWVGGRKRTSLLEVPRPTSSNDHPTMKPLEVIIETLGCHKSGVVLDTFGGSGSTMMAAQQLGFTAYLIEWQPKYADVIRKRWGNFARENDLDVGDGL